MELWNQSQAALEFTMTERQDPVELCRKSPPTGKTQIVAAGIDVHSNAMLHAIIPALPKGFLMSFRLPPSIQIMSVEAAL